MIAFLLLSLPIFGVVALGWGAVRTNLSTSSAIDALGAFSFRFAVPALVFRLIAGQPLGQSFNPIFFGGYLASGSLVFAYVLGLSRFFEGQSVAAAGARATTATVSNLGFLGPPLMLTVFEQRGAGPLAMAILAEIMILLSMGGVLMGASRDGGPGIGSLLPRGAVLNPVVAAIALGAVLAATDTPLPATLDRLLQMDGFWVHAGVLLSSLPSAGSNYVLAQRYSADTEIVSAAIVLSTIVSVATVPASAWLMLG
jgi:malonate transporter and related proteins